MLSPTVKFTKPQDSVIEKVPADVYQVVLSDVQEVEGRDFNTNEPKQQLRFMAEIVNGDEKGKAIFFYTSYSWFNGGKNAKPSKLYNLVKTVYTKYHPDIAIDDMAIIEASDVNSLIGKQLRVTVEETENGWPKVTAFVPVKDIIPYKKEASKVDEDFIEEIEGINVSNEMKPAN